MFNHPHHAALALFITLSVAFGVPSVSSALKSTSLTVGSTGEQVKTLQTNLIDKGYLAGSATGSYDTSTAEAVKKFQTSLGLTADGIAGTTTLTKAGVIIPTGVATTTATTTKTAGTPDVGYLPPPPPMGGPAEEFDAEGCAPHMLVVKRAVSSPNTDISLEATSDHELAAFTFKAGSCDVEIQGVDFILMNVAEEGPEFDSVAVNVPGMILTGTTMDPYETKHFYLGSGLELDPYEEETITFSMLGMEVSDDTDENAITVGLVGIDGIYTIVGDDTLEVLPFGMDPNGIWGHVLDVYDYDEADETQCNDDLDNDGDGQIDYPADPGCTSFEDSSEYNPVVAGDVELDVYMASPFLLDTTMTMEPGDDVEDVPVLYFKMEADGGEVNVESLPVSFDATEDMNTFIRGAKIVNIESDATLATVDFDDIVADDATLVFEDLDISLDDGEWNHFGIFIDVDSALAGFDTGSEVSVKIYESDVNEIEAEDEDGDSLTEDQMTSYDISGSDFTFVTDEIEPDIEVTLDGTSYEETYNDDGTTDKIVFEIEFEIEALGDDIVIDKSCEENNADTAGQGFEYGVSSPSKNTTTCVVTSSADDATVHTWLVEEGESEEFILIVTMDPTADYAAFIALMSINWGTNLLDVSPDFFFTEGLGLGTEYETGHETVDV